MPLCRYVDDQGNAQFALFDGSRICPLNSFLEETPQGKEVFQKDDAWLAELIEKAPEAGWIPVPANLLPPVPNPGKILCIGLNYRDHAIETGAEIPSEPVVFSKFNTALIGHGDVIRLPKVAQRVDYEAELVVIIGTEGKHIPAEQAMNHVFGYTCGHDVSARDWQKGRPGGQWLLGKSFDSFAPLGPCMVTQQEVADPSNLRVQLHLNGDVMQDSTTAQLIFDIPTLIAHLSQIMTLQPGDVIFTGTPPGVGAARKPPVFLKPGDECTVEIAGIGRLTNVCQAE